MPFDEIWDRIRSETNLQTLTDLAVAVGTTQPHVSRKKKLDEFSAEWALAISLKYGLRVDWVLRGVLPVRIDSQIPNYRFEILQDLDEWLSEIVDLEPYRKEWFRASVEDAFPLFREWQKRKRAEGVNNTG